MVKRIKPKMKSQFEMLHDFKMRGWKVKIDYDPETREYEGMIEKRDRKFFSLEADRSKVILALWFAANGVDGIAPSFPSIEPVGFPPIVS